VPVKLYVAKCFGLCGYGDLQAYSRKSKKEIRVYGGILCACRRRHRAKCRGRTGIALRGVSSQFSGSFQRQHTARLAARTDAAGRRVISDGNQALPRRARSLRVCSWLETTLLPELTGKIGLRQVPETKSLTKYFWAAHCTGFEVNPCGETVCSLTACDPSQVPYRSLIAKKGRIGAHLLLTPSGH
jgi:hypothetical protein